MNHDLFKDFCNVAKLTAKVDTNKKSPSEVGVDAAKAMEQLREDNTHKLPRYTLSLIAKVLTTVYESNAASETPITPFRKVPDTFIPITNPKAVLDYLRSANAKMSVGGKEVPVSQNTLATMSGINKGSLSSITNGRMNFSANGLEQWRKVLVDIGRLNGMDELTAYDSPSAFLDSMLDDYASLTSRLKPSVVVEWATVHAQLSPNTTSEKVAAAKPNYSECFQAIVNVWRQEYATGQMQTYDDKLNFDALLKTHTASRSMARGFHKMVRAIHSNMPPCNSRVRYPTTYYQEYVNRYRGKAVETGLTADILIAYCFYLGMNPMSLLVWFADYEVRVPGDYAVMSNEVDSFNLIAWKGLLPPWEYQKLALRCMQLGLVSDQERWIFTAFDAKHIYHNLPTVSTVLEALGDRAMAMRSIVEDALDMIPDNVGSWVGMPYKVLASCVSMSSIGLTGPYKQLFVYMLAGMVESGFVKLSDDCELDDAIEQGMKVFRRMFSGALAPEQLTLRDSVTYDSLSGFSGAQAPMVDTFYKGVVSIHDLGV